MSRIVGMSPITTGRFGVATVVKDALTVCLRLRPAASRYATVAPAILISTWSYEPCGVSTSPIGSSVWARRVNSIVLGLNSRSAATLGSVELFSVIEVMFRLQERICSEGSSPTRTCKGVVGDGGREKTIGIPGSPLPDGVPVFGFALPPQPVVSSNRNSSATSHAALIDTPFKPYL